MVQNEKKQTRQQRWTKLRPTKQTLVWFCLGAVLGTLLIGFGWGGWVTGGNARNMALQSGVDAVVDRLTPICVYQFNQDPEKTLKLAALKELGFRQRTEYVTEQGWATMPGEAQPDSKIANECARELLAMK